MIATDVKLISETVQELLKAIEDEHVDLDQGLVCWNIIEESRKALAVAGEVLAARMAEAMPDKQHTIMGVGTFEKHRKTSRTKWDVEDLRRAVLDTRRVNPNSGEVVEETPLEKVLEVWNLGVPRITAVRGRGLDPDEFCRVEKGAMTLQLVTS